MLTTQISQNNGLFEGTPIHVQPILKDFRAQNEHIPSPAYILPLIFPTFNLVRKSNKMSTHKPIYILSFNTANQTAPFPYLCAQFY